MDGEVICAKIPRRNGEISTYLKLL
uniref:Uncharacterized protein n=1 Tax=Cupriavidus taiwanensis TaxID=164546 RepID=A0A375HA99_9BURK|nr:protein of unknown function [Cupriavidus taiwanensis]